MKFVFVTYRWGDDLVGGAESHHRRLAQELVDRGHEVEVITSTAHDLSPFWHWGTEWQDNAPGDNAAIPVKRLPRRRLPRQLLALSCKFIQWRMEAEEAALPRELTTELARHFNTDFGVHLLHGWHYPEIHGGETARWSHPAAHLVVNTGAQSHSRLILRGQASRALILKLYSGTQVLSQQSFKSGYVEFFADLPKGSQQLLRLEVSPPRRWIRDHRTLGCWFNSMELKADGRPSFWTDLSEDFRSLGRRSPDIWQGWLLARAKSRPSLLNRIFDSARGPKMKGLRAELERLTDAIVIHCNLPWGSFTSVRKNDLTMPLWHIDDEFYYWQHWIAAMRRSRFALANTPFTEREFFPRIGVKAQFVGPPIWQPELPSTEAGQAFRNSMGILPNDLLVLTVCRKAGEKRYDAVAKAVTALRSQGRSVKMLGIGPDVDGLPFEYDGCRWIGKLAGADLQRAYAACDVFALMSESESFGMVVPEAWHHGKPVIVNRLCQPVTSLVDHGLDGFAVTPGAELIEAMIDLSSNEALRIRMGEAGRRKALQHYVRGAAAERLLEGLRRYPRE